MISTDTIAAIATAPGRGAIGIIRVSGTKVPELAATLLGIELKPRIASFSRFLAADGGVIDEGVILYFPAPASFTGEHVLELQGHGGVVVQDLVMQRLLALGCRPARPGEFSERAFLNGKMDIAQAEAVADLIDAGSAAAARAAVRSMRGEFSSCVERLQKQLTEIRKLVESAIDFPDEDLDFATDAKFLEQLLTVLTALDAVQVAARRGASIREGLNVVIAGRPNAGKSCLLNRLAGDDVAIVSDVPGTTRDLLRQSINLEGLAVNLVDTAGLRPTTDLIEAEGVRRARSEMSRADLVLYVLDAATTPGVSAETLQEVAGDFPAGVEVALVMNKIDLLSTPPHLQIERDPVQLHVSAKSGAGIDQILAHLKAVAGHGSGEGGTLSARRRHVDALARARQWLENAADCFSTTGAPELLAEDLRLAQKALSEITGELGSEDLLGEIFRSFCIGK